MEGEALEGTATLEVSSRRVVDELRRVCALRSCALTARYLDAVLVDSTRVSAFWICESSLFTIRLPFLSQAPSVLQASPPLTFLPLSLKR